MWPVSGSRKCGAPGELGELAAELRAQGELLSRALGLQEELIDLVLRGKDARTIVEHLAERLGAPIWLLDSDRRTLAHASGGSLRAVAPPRGSELARVLGSRHPDHAPRSVELATAAGVRPFLVQSVATDRETFGYLMVGSTALGPVDRTTFHGGRLVLALRLLIERSIAEAEERLGRDLIQDALLRGGDGAVPAGLAARLGCDDDGPAVVARPARGRAAGLRRDGPEQAACLHGGAGRAARWQPGTGRDGRAGRRRDHPTGRGRPLRPEVPRPGVRVGARPGHRDRDQRHDAPAR